MSNQAGTSAEGNQARVIGFLANPASYADVQRVERFETHGNLVFLASSEAWKIKRAVRFPYMDFSTLEKRRLACLREVEVNRRFSDDLYLGCVPITRSAAGALSFSGAGEIVEWAVHMRRFEQSNLLGSLAMQGRITGDLAKQLADLVYESHAGAERIAPSSGAVPIRRLVNFVCSSLRKSGAFDSADISCLACQVESQLERVAATLDVRAAKGFVRRCHGDLHLANVVLWHSHPLLYDAIEFDEAIATIDTLYDLAFLLMDLDWHGQRHQANVVLNRYLWRSQDELDLKGLAALPVFLALRAGIRAMVAIDRAAQEDTCARMRDFDRAQRYVRAGLDYLAQPAPQLTAIGGLSGTGKSTLGAALRLLWVVRQALCTSGAISNARQSRASGNWIACQPVLIPKRRATRSINSSKRRHRWCSRRAVQSLSMPSMQERSSGATLKQLPSPWASRFTGSGSRLIATLSWRA